MANNLVEYLAQLKASDPKRANWLMDCPNVGTNDFGFIKPKLVKEIIAGTRVRYDFKAAFSTNPTVSPVLSRAKATVVAIWIPVSLYVPALRDGVQVKAGKTDYSFPVINFNYNAVDSFYRSDENAQLNGVGIPYVPANSIYTELNMWKPYFQPVGFLHTLQDSGVGYPEAKNAIPLLGYYDFVRHYVLNSQTPYAPIRTKGFSRRVVGYRDDGNLNGDGRSPFYATQSAVDGYYSRDDFDELFQIVRQIGSQYYQGENRFDISDTFGYFLGLNDRIPFPAKSMTNLISSDGSVDEDQFVAFNDDHFGECRQTYFADYYTAYLSNENVEYERSTAKIQADDGGVITMEQVYSAQRVQNFIRRTIFKNSDYPEFVDAEYGIKPPTTLNKPMFLGAVSTWLSFNDVIAQSQGVNDGTVESNTALGSRASLGFGRMVTGSLRGNDDRPFVDFTAREPGYLMVLEYIVPEVAYWQGYDPLYDKRSLMSIYYPAFDKDGYQDKQLRHLVEQYDDTLNRLPYGMTFDEFNIAYAQEPAWWEYMATYGRLTGQMVDEGVYRHWVFHRTIKPRGVVFPSTPAAAANGVPNYLRISNNDLYLRNILDIYVNPEDFNYIFANVEGLDNIQTYYRHELKLYQPLSHRFLSY